jgi:four helix bundle protein
MERENIILAKSFSFACDIIDFHEILKGGKHFEIASQVIRSGTSIGANIREAQRAESKADFRHKLRIALKEADETKYWLELIDQKLIDVDENLKNAVEEIIKLLVAIINSSNK